MNNTMIRSRTRAFFKENQQEFIWMFAILLVTSALLGGVERLVLMTYYNITFTIENFVNYSQIVSLVESQFNLSVTIIEMLFGVLTTFISASIGIAILKGVDKNVFRWRDVLIVKDLKWQTLILIILITQLIVSALSILIIPGIIATYSLAMSHYLFYDHPDNSALDSLKMSHAMMRGKRFQLFKNELYYIVWLIAAFFVSLVLLNLGFFFALVGLVGLVVVSTYLSLQILIMYVIFYRENI